MRRAQGHQQRDDVNRKKRRVNCISTRPTNSSTLTFTVVLTDALETLPAGNDAHEHHDNGDYEEDMNEPADGVATHQTQNPEDEQHYCNCV